LLNSSRPTLGVYICAHPPPPSFSDMIARNINARNIVIIKSNGTKNHSMYCSLEFHRQFLKRIVALFKEKQITKSFSLESDSSILSFELRQRFCQKKGLHFHKYKQFI